MKIHSIIGTALACAALSSPVAAHGPGQPAQKSAETVRPLFSRTIPNIPGKSLITLEVYYPPGAASPPHRQDH